MKSLGKGGREDRVQLRISSLQLLGSRRSSGSSTRAMMLLRKPRLLRGVVPGFARQLNVHEYISMDVMRRFEIPVPKSAAASTPEEAEAVYEKVIGKGNDCVIKAMVLTGGRGLGHFSNGFKGGVHLCNKPGDVKTFASKMIGQNLITKQTTKQGLPCNKVMLAERMYMRREMYISVSPNTYRC